MPLCRSCEIKELRKETSNRSPFMHQIEIEEQ
jgi:hypothetical protein